MSKQYYVVDSWAIMALIKKEASHARVREILDLAKNKSIDLSMSFINLAEVYYSLCQDFDPLKAEGTIALLQKVPIAFFSATNNRVMRAAQVKADYAIAFGDCFTIQLALEKKAPILTGDPEFKKVEKLVKIEWLSKV